MTSQLFLSNPTCIITLSERKRRSAAASPHQHLTDASKQNGLQRAQRGSKPGVTQRAEIKARRAANMQPAEESHRGASPLKLYLGQILLCRTNRVPRCIHTTAQQPHGAAPPAFIHFDSFCTQTRQFQLGTDACWETGSRRNTPESLSSRWNQLPGTSEL